MGQLLTRAKAPPGGLPRTLTALYIERNPKMIKSMTSFPYIMNSL